VSGLTTALHVLSTTALIANFALGGSAIATADPNNSSPDASTLAAALSKGYSLDNCQPTDLSLNYVLAALVCGQSSDPKGPSSGRYILFSNGTDMAGSFDAVLKDNSLTNCGTDSSQSPTTWSLGTSGQTAGRLACGTHQNAATVTWTNYSKKVMGHIVGSSSDVDALYQWWTANG
jgi:hypothetical protein